MVAFDVLLSVFSNGLRLSEPDRPNFWVGEDYGGNVVIGKEGLREVWWSEKPIR